jgi:hypothetical protein
MPWLSKAIVFGLMVKTMTGYIPSELDVVSTIGFGLDSSKSYIIQPLPNGAAGGGGSVFQSCVNGMPYGILVAITETCPFGPPIAPPSFRPCTTGIPLGILLGVTCP